MEWTKLHGERYHPKFLTAGIDEALAKTTDPLHVKILKNFRRHYILEVTGNR
ncbi:hypothetical protein [Rhodococcus opacus]|uniref:hypothetical protein n=1 Tax=Rhodococcus opacus TaxID=37919 RepID=UPI0013002119|nr:hypothetical protein [Rhodococcus opacus]